MTKKSKTTTQKAEQDTENQVDHTEKEALENAGEQERDNAQKITELESLIEEMRDQTTRALAESENIRKRAEREAAEARKYAVTNMTKDFIDVLENLYRATEHTDANDSSETHIKSILDGLELTKDSFIKVLNKYGVTRVCPEIGDKFDHNLHQAISQQESNECKSGHIMQIVQAGYLIGDRLIRPAMVIVAK